MPLRGVRDRRSPDLLASTAGVGVLAIRRGGAEREKPFRGTGRTPRTGIHACPEYLASHVPHQK
jgi:hypothetical protein